MRLMAMFTAAALAPITAARSTNWAAPILAAALSFAAQRGVYGKWYGGNQAQK
jgi:hypothetical protein